MPLLAQTRGKPLFNHYLWWLLPSWRLQLLSSYLGQRLTCPFWTLSELKSSLSFSVVGIYGLLFPWRHSLTTTKINGGEAGKHMEYTLALLKSSLLLGLMLLSTQRRKGIIVHQNITLLKGLILCHGSIMALKGGKSIISPWEVQPLCRLQPRFEFQSLQWRVNTRKSTITIR